MGEERATSLPSNITKHAKRKTKMSTPSYWSSLFKKSSKLSFKPMGIIRFIIGPDRHSCDIHKEAACRHSPIISSAWDAAFDSELDENNRLEYRLESTTLRVFEMIVQFLYTANFDFKMVKFNKDDFDARLSNLIGLWILTGELGMHTLQILTLKELGEIWYEHKLPLSVEALSLVHDRTGPESMLRAFIVPMIDAHDEVSTIKVPEGCPTELQMDLVFCLWRTTESKSASEPKNSSSNADG
ncbi:uncharacterized protein LY89DRAFT_728926 [Mollisia scopiformis]|uniref:BTB domain-containing protein n=1 Tax=Mollisia scopiformis TaxID=149040 RepID=A0A194XRJ4_MOLSC|nr:uncharacterized protein LY89DRAFT_728926 [Mollisia scopiformis]KUJ22813.1 hypothetical protein LY89DRAFT_728926 [Mollisia scopiformis]